MTDLEAFDAYLAALPGKPPGALSRRAYVSTLRVYLATEAGPDDVPAITAYLAAKTKGATNGSKAPWRSAFKHWMRFRGLSPDDIQVRADSSQDANLRDALETDELADYHVAVDRIEHPAVRCLLHLLPYTGQRIHEVCKLRVEEIATKGSTRGLVFAGKRGKARFVALSTKAVGYLDAHIKATAPTAWVFPGIVDPSTPMKPDTVRKLLREVCEAKTWTPHVLRHTFATRMLDKGANLLEVQTLLGHTHVETTAIYAKPTAGALKRAVERLDED